MTNTFAIIAALANVLGITMTNGNMRKLNRIANNSEELWTVEKAIQYYEDPEPQASTWEMEIYSGIDDFIVINDTDIPEDGYNHGWDEEELEWIETVSAKYEYREKLIQWALSQTDIDDTEEYMEHADTVCRAHELREHIIAIEELVETGVIFDENQIDKFLKHLTHEYRLEDEEGELEIGTYGKFTFYYNDIGPHYKLAYTGYWWELINHSDYVHVIKRFLVTIYEDMLDQYYALLYKLR